MTIRFGVVGIEHRHIYHLIGGLLDAGATCVGYCTSHADPLVLQGVQSRFPDLKALASADELLDDDSIQLIVTADVPCRRAPLAMDAMRRGKDVLTDKPGVTSFEQLAAVQAAVRETGRIFAICFSERHIVPSVAMALKLVQDGALGQVFHTLSMGPHRLNAATRPDWFFDKTTYGGILVDIASHQIDQFLVLTGSADATVGHAVHSHIGQATPASFQDFGEIALASKTNFARGYIRVDWFTPDGLPTWGDGRLFIGGTEGSIEIRKYVDIEGRAGGEHLFLCDRKGTRHIDCSQEPITFFKDLVADVRNRTDLAVPQDHVFAVSRLALEADALATTSKATLGGAAA